MYSKLSPEREQTYTLPMPGIVSPIVAIVTPFAKDGSVDWEAFKTYLHALESWGVTAIVTNGTTGEFPSLGLDERQQICEFVRANYRGHIINHISATCIRDVRRLIAGSSSNSDAVLILPPYYFAGATESGLLNFFEAALEKNKLPVYLYNFPKHTGNVISPGCVSAMHKAGVPIVGVKDSSGYVDHALSYKVQHADLEVYLGNDAKALEALRKGLSGSVTGGGNALPEVLIAIRELRLSDETAAENVQKFFNQWNDYRKASQIAEIPLIKASLSARIDGFPAFVRPPFVAASPREAAAIAAQLRRCVDMLPFRLRTPWCTV